MRLRIACQYVSVFDTRHLPSNNACVNREAFSRRLAELLERNPRVPRMASGEVNVSALSKVVGVNQPTLARMLNGASGMPRPDNARKLMSFFGVTLGQLIGDEPMPDEAAQQALHPPGDTKPLNKEFGASWSNTSAPDADRDLLYATIEALPAEELKALASSALEILAPRDRLDVATDALRNLRDDVSPVSE